MMQGNFLSEFVEQHKCEFSYDILEKLNSLEQDELSIAAKFAKELYIHREVNKEKNRREEHIRNLIERAESAMEKMDND